MLTAIGSPVETDMENALSAALGQAPSKAGAQRILRILEVLSELSALRSCVRFQAELLAYPDPDVRSQAALLIAKTSKNTVLAGRLLADPDPRVQASAAEALWAFDADEALPLLRIAVRSKNERVMGNAAVGLYRFGELSGISVMLEMAR